MMTKACAIILAAGQGTRMKSKYPKVLCQVLFKPMINWVTDWCLKAGYRRNLCGDRAGCAVSGAGAAKAVLHRIAAAAAGDRARGNDGAFLYR